MKKFVITLRRGPSIQVDVPETTGKGKDKRKVERSAFGAIRVYPGIPKTVTKDELDVIKAAHPSVRLEVNPYVESKRVDRRGASEAEVAALAEKEGISNLSFAEQVRVLRKRGKIVAPVKNAPKASRGGDPTVRKPRTDK